MDTYEASKVVMSRIQTLDPENASKIMGYILLQDQVDKEMIRLAFGPETLIHSNISRAKACLGIPPAKPAGPFPKTSPRININIPNSGFHFSGTSPSSVSPVAAFRRTSPRPFSYAAALGDDSVRLLFLDEDPAASPGGRSYPQFSLTVKTPGTNPSTLFTGGAAPSTTHPRFSRQGVTAGRGRACISCGSSARMGVSVNSRMVEH